MKLKFLCDCGAKLSLDEHFAKRISTSTEAITCPNCHNVFPFGSDKAIAEFFTSYRRINDVINSDPENKFTLLSVKIPKDQE